MKSVFVCFKLFGLLGLLIGTLTIDSQAFSQSQKPQTVNGLDNSATRVCKANLATAIEEVINRPAFRRSRWGIEIQTLAGESLYSLNQDKFFTPASSLKLLTTAAALTELGAEYRLETPIYAEGEAPNLMTLRVEGRGDPSLSSQSLKQLARQLQTLGIKQINQLIIDDSYFDPPKINPTWEWLDVHSYFATAASSVILNRNTVTLTLLPQQIGQPVKYYWNDAIAARQWRVVNNGKTASVGTKYNIEIDGELGKPSLIIRGELAADESPDIWDLAVVDPADYFLESLRVHLARAGIKVNQGITVEQSEKSEQFQASQSTKLESELLALPAPTIPEIISEINQTSNNLYAEVLGKIIAEERQERNTDAVAAIGQSLDKLGVDKDEYVLVDASGLSRQNLVTPAALVKTLSLMSRSPQADSYRQSLALAGVNGTLKHRFLNTAIAHNLQGKTGTLTGVGTLSGYLETADHQKLAFSILLNNSNLKSNQIRKAIDQVVVILGGLTRC